MNEIAEKMLYFAARGGNVKTVTMLLEKGVSCLTVFDDENFSQYITALYAAVVGLHFETVEILSKAGALVNGDYPNQQTALQFFLENVDEEVLETDILTMVRLLLFNHVKIDTPGLLEAAVDRGFTTVVQELLKWGAGLDDDLNGDYLQTAFQTALAKDNFEATAMLIAAGVNVAQYGLVDAMEAGPKTLALMAAATKNQIWVQMLGSLFDDDEDDEIIRNNLEVLILEADIFLHQHKDLLNRERENLPQEIFQYHLPDLVDLCLGMQSLELPAFVTLAIVDERIPEMAEMPMCWKWDVITKVKHFRATLEK